MTKFSAAFVCQCGVETSCKAEDLHLGQVFECSACHQVWGCVYPKGGGKAWIRISCEEVLFHSLLGREEDAG